MIDPHPKLPAAEGWQIAATAPQTGTWVQLGYPPSGFSGACSIIVAHWASDLSGEEQPPFEGWFQANVGNGGKVHGFHEAPAGFIAWRPLWPADRATEAAAHDARVVALHEANNREIDRRRHLAGAVRSASATFMRYADLHAAKLTTDGLEKAAANRALAMEMELALVIADPACG